jgi:hypothetical protein
MRVASLVLVVVGGAPVIPQRGALAVVFLLASLAVALAPAPARAEHWLDPYAGDWWFHSFSLSLDDMGYGYAVYRTYVWCGDLGIDPGRADMAPCDRMDDHQIRSGGRALIHLDAPGTDYATGHVLWASTYAGFGDQHGPVLSTGHELILRMEPNDRATLLYPDDPTPIITLCHAGYPHQPGDCGA